MLSTWMRGQVGPRNMRRGEADTRLISTAGRYGCRKDGIVHAASRLLDLRSLLVPLGYRSRETVLAEINLTRTEDYSRSDLADCLIYSKLDRKMVLDSREFRPGSSLTREHALQHVFRSGVAQHLWKLRVQYGWEDGNVTRITLVQDRSRFRKVVREDAHLRKDL